MILQFYLIILFPILLTISIFIFKKNKNMVIRGVTLLVLLHLLVGVLMGGKIPSMGLAALIGFGAAIELGGLITKNKYLKICLGLLGIVMALLPFTNNSFSWVCFIGAWIFCFLGTFLLPSFISTKKIWSACIFIFVLCLGVYSFIGLFHVSSFNWIVLILLIQLNDVFALLVGRKIGKHFIFPSISPNKTLEGVIAGILGIILGVLLLNYAIPIFENTDVLKQLMIAFVIWFGALFGDLFFSKIKRLHSLKDYSALLPGHGGVLDRFDNVLFVSPIFLFILI